MKSVLITGASSGLGQALALHYAQNHYRNPVRLCLGGRNAEVLNKVADSCRHYGCDVYTQCVDVTNRDTMREWVLDCEQRFSLDIVIANAGISGGTLGQDIHDWVQSDQTIFDVNLTGVLHTILPIIPKFCARQAGHIVIMSSLASFAAWPGAPAYAASKAAVRIYGEALAGSLKDHYVFVSTICPGFIDTPMTQKNAFPMPFKMNANQAAKKIAHAIECKRIRYCFPWPTALISQFLGLIPLPLRQILLKKAPKKQ
jgi:short-subunit dehydrogenase